MDRIFTRHWNGRLPLAAAIALPLVGLHLLFVAFVARVDLPSGFVSGFLAAFVLLMLVWQVVGVFRSVDRSIVERRGIMPVFVGYAAIALVGLSTINQLAGLAIPRWRAEPPARVSTSEVGLDGLHHEFVLDGPVSLRGFSELAGLIAEHPSVRVIALRSVGGSISAARGMARLVEEAGLETRAVGPCYSACALVFVAGAPRILTEEGELGFHRYEVGTYRNLGDLHLLDLEEEQARDRAYYRRRGVSADFLDKVFTTASGTIWRPTREELRAAGVLRGQ